MIVTTHIDEGAELAARHRARRKGVLTIGAIVGIAILSVVVAVMWSAQRADEVALELERQLFAQALSDHAKHMKDRPVASAPTATTTAFIDTASLAEIGTRLQLKDLHIVREDAPPDDHTYQLADPTGHPIARFAWSPNRPGAQILRSVAPFITLAMAGFLLLAALVLLYMRRTSATISRSEHQLRHLALHDPLCGLPNRAYFAERLNAVMNDVARGGDSAAVFYIDLDHFKDVNDTLGHPVGDDLLCAVTLRLGHAVRGQDLVARLGGDEFAVLSAQTSELAALRSTADRLINTLCAPYVINGQNIIIGASIGIALIDGRITSAADVMRYADMALYRAKNEGRNRACIYDTAMDHDLTHRKFLETDLRTAIEQGELSVAYQPVVNNAGEKILGVEALCRWHHAELGDIAPSEFIPIAENSGLIVALGEFVLRRACLDGQAWPGITVAVNVSPLQFRRSDFVDVVEQILSETGFDPARLELEVTESTLLGNVDSAELSMFRLKALGARLALDDFGTGYSSLLYLRRFPFDKLKIDRSFINNIEKAADAAAIVHAVIGLGRGLGMKVTAEGVETAEQHLFLRAAGIHSLQGYRFGRPCSALEISARLAHPEQFPVSDPGLAMAG